MKHQYTHVVLPTVAHTFHYVLFPGYLCPDLIPTPHLVEPTNLDKHRTGDTVTFRCAAGYLLSGYKPATCIYVPPDIMASWSSAQPTCIG
jgi:hypothetical protein